MVLQNGTKRLQRLILHSPRCNVIALEVAETITLREQLIILELAFYRVFKLGNGIHYFYNIKGNMIR